MAVTAFAPAKVNLYLHVTGRRADGYHLLDSLVAFADIGDRLRAEPAASLSLVIDGPEAASLAAVGDDNLVLRAARLLADRVRDHRWRRAASGKASAGRRRDRRRVERRCGGAARAQAAVADIAGRRGALRSRRQARRRCTRLSLSARCLGRGDRRAPRAGRVAAGRRHSAGQPAQSAADCRGIRRPARPVRPYRAVRADAKRAVGSRPCIDAVPQ